MEISVEDEGCCWVCGRWAWLAVMVRDANAATTRRRRIIEVPPEDRGMPTGPWVQGRCGPVIETLPAHPREVARQNPGAYRDAQGAGEGHRQASQEKLR